jgi:hypothetical protein
MTESTSEKYNTSIRTELDEQDWEEVLPRVLKYAESAARTLSWLWIGVDPMELVNEAISLAYGLGEGGTYRNWDRQKCPKLETFLIGIIKSIMSHKAEHEANFPKEPLTSEDGSARDITPGIDANLLGDAFDPATPEDKTEHHEQYLELERKLDKIANENDDLLLVIAAIEDGCSKPKDIARETKIEVTRVYKLLSQLRKKLTN